MNFGVSMKKDGEKKSLLFIDDDPSPYSTERQRCTVCGTRNQKEVKEVREG